MSRSLTLTLLPPLPAATAVALLAALVAAVVDHAPPDLGWLCDVATSLTVAVRVAAERLVHGDLHGVLEALGAL